MYLRLGGGKLGGTALRGGGELGGLGLGPIELRGEGGVALLEEGAGLLGGDRGRVRLGADGVHLAPELADGGVGPLGDGGRVAAEEPELLVGDEQRHRCGLGTRRPNPIPLQGNARWVYEVLGFADRRWGPGRVVVAEGRKRREANGGHWRDGAGREAAWGGGSNIRRRRCRELCKFRDGP